MSEQTLNLDKNWNKIIQNFRDHFKSRNLEIKEEIIKYSKNGEYLILNRDGGLSGAMPLHENNFSQVKEVTFRDSEIEFKSDNFTYIYRR